jgi:hypothetical protein
MCGAGIGKGPPPSGLSFASGSEELEDFRDLRPCSAIAIPSEQKAGSTGYKGEKLKGKSHGNPVAQFASLATFN